MSDASAPEPLADTIVGEKSPVQAARDGLTADALDTVRNALFGDSAAGAASARTLAGALGVSERTLSRRASEGGGALTRRQSDRLLLVAELYDLAVRALGSPEAARAWLNRPHALLDDETPLARLDTLAGAREVEAVLYQIEYGMPA